MATRKKKTVDSAEPVVIKGTHLTVTKWPNGQTKLEWDDEALLREVREATSNTKPQVKAKTVRKKKTA
jgi:hypothetical protein